jgi:hypothetical protein
VRLLDERGRSKSQLAGELGIHDSMLTRWKADLEGVSSAEAFPGWQALGRRGDSCAGRICAGAPQRGRLGYGGSAEEVAIAAEQFTQELFQHWHAFRAGGRMIEWVAQLLHSRI